MEKSYYFLQEKSTGKYVDIEPVNTLVGFSMIKKNILEEVLKIPTIKDLMDNDIQKLSEFINQMLINKNNVKAVSGFTDNMHSLQRNSEEVMGAGDFLHSAKNTKNLFDLYFFLQDIEHLSNNAPQKVVTGFKKLIENIEKIEVKEALFKLKEMNVLKIELGYGLHEMVRNGIDHGKIQKLIKNFSEEDYVSCKVSQADFSKKSVSYAIFLEDNGYLTEDGDYDENISVSKGFPTVPLLKKFMDERMANINLKKFSVVKKGTQVLEVISDELWNNKTDFLHRPIITQIQSSLEKQNIHETIENHSSSDLELLKEHLKSEGIDPEDLLLNIKEKKYSQRKSVKKAL